MNALPNSSRTNRLGFLDAIVFLIPALQFFEVHIVGRLMGGEIIILGLFLFIFREKGNKLWRGWPKLFVLLLGVWLLSQITTDVIRGTPFVDYIRGWSRIGMTFINFAVLFLLIYDAKRPATRMKLFVAGLIAGGLLDFIISAERGPGLTLSAGFITLWKYGFGWPVTLAVVFASAVLWYRGNRSMALGLLVAMGAVDIFGWRRSLGGMCFLTVSVLWMKDHFSHFTFSARHVGRLAAIALLLLSLGYGLLNVYEYAAREGWLGETNKRLIMVQGGGVGGVILGGRIGILASWSAIKQSPVVGYGSWAEAPYWLYAKWFKLAYQAGYYKRVQRRVRDIKRGENIIPSHSILFGSWVHAGLGAVPVWICVIWLAIISLVEINVRKAPMAVFIIFLSIMLGWHILFSPYGNMQRQMIPYGIVFLLTGLKLTKKIEMRISNKLRNI